MPAFARFLTRTAVAGLAALSMPPAAASNGPFPLGIAADAARPHFVDRAGRPFLLACDIAQALPNRLKIDEVRAYLDRRKEQGYNAFWFIIASPNAMIDDTVFARPAPGPGNAYGVRPFDNDREDFSAPNPEYFAHVVRIVDEAAQRGMLAGIAPAYVGAAGRDSLPLMKNAGIDGCRAYGEFIGRLLRRRANVFWIHHGDQNPWNYGGAPTAALADAFVAGLRSTDTVHPRFHTAISRRIAPPALPPFKSRTSSYLAQFDSTGRRVNPMPWLNLNTVYARNRGQYAEMLAQMREAWTLARGPEAARLPFVLLDGVCTHYNDDARANRAQGYYAVLSGAAGFFNGNIRICWFMSPDTPPAAVRDWRIEMESVDERSSARTARFFQSLPWWTLLPETDEGFVSPSTALTAAALSEDRRLAVVYLPVRRTVTVALERLSAPSASATWFNPRTGESVEAGAFPAAPTEFSPPAGRDDDAEDWVLRLDAAPP